MTSMPIPLADWPAALATAAAEGYAYLDLLTAVDRPDDDEIEIVACVLDPRDARLQRLRTRCPRDGGVLPSVTGSHPAASWHEREIAEMFGLGLSGHPDPRPLLLAPDLGMAPLRKEAVLAARAVRPWPGAQGDDGGEGVAGRERRASARRRQPPPGVPEGWLSEPAP